MKERWIAVIAAEEQELAGMDEFMEDRRTETGAAGCVYRMGRVGSHQVAAMRCGIGKVNAAISAQAMIDRFQPEALINIGAVQQPGVYRRAVPVSRSGHTCGGAAAFGPQRAGCLRTDERRS